MKNIYLIDLKPVNFTFFLRKFGSLFSHSLCRGDRIEKAREAWLSKIRGVSLGALGNYVAEFWLRPLSTHPSV